MPEATGYGISKIVLCDEAGVPYDLSGGSGSLLAADAPNGVNDTIGLNNVAAAAAASGSPFGGGFQLRSGLYKTDFGVDMPTFVTGFGAGKNATVIRKTDNCDLIRHIGASNGTRNQRGGMRDVRLDGGGFTGAIVKAKWADHLVYRDAWFYNNNGYGWYGENLWDTVLVDVEIDTVSGSDGFHPAIFLTSNADDSTNIFTMRGGRIENYKDGAIWMSSGPMVSPYTMATGPNPVYGVELWGVKMESPQIKGIPVAMSADVRRYRQTGGYFTARGLYSGVSTGRTMFSLIGASDIKIRDVHIRVEDTFASGNPTASEVFRLFTDAGGIAITGNFLDIVQNPSTAVFHIAGGAPDMDTSGNHLLPGQIPTMFAVSGAGVWPTSRASAATVTLPRSAPLVKITGTTNITSMTADVPGRVVTLLFTGVLTLTDGSNINAAGNFITAPGATWTAVSDGTNWNEMSRSAN